MSAKIGKFSTHCEYEVVQAVDTPFVSKSYLFEYNPFTHTGVWATTGLSKTWSVGNGLAVGNDNFINRANRLTYLGQLQWAPPDGKTQVQFNASITRPTYDVTDAFNFYNFYEARLTHKFTDKFTYVLSSAFSHEDGIPGVGTATWYGAVNYFIYKHTDKVVSTLRAEVFEDSQGFRTGFAGLYTELTYGVAWTPTPGLIIRPSVRYDNNANSAAFEGKHDMFIGSLEMIFRW